MNKFLLVLAILFSCLNGLKAQDAPKLRSAKMYTEFPRCEVKLNGQYFLDYWHDFKYTTIGPTRWKKKEWLIFSGVVAGAAALYSMDQQIFDWTQRTRSHGTEVAARWLEPFGNGRWPIFTTAALYAYGAILKKNKSQRVALLILESYLISGIYAQLSKYAFGRWRPWNFPEGEEQYNIWEGPHIKDPKASFFSGHSSTSYAFATTLAFEFKDKPWVGILAFSVATASNITRIHDRAHWASDVFIGSAIGYLQQEQY